jgi:Cysteine-rich secretory protein family
MRKLVLGLILAVGVWSVLPAAAQASTTDDEAAFVAKINELRASKGLSALQVNANLVAKTRDWSAGMAAAGKIWHSTLSDGVTEDWKKLGENVGMGGSVDSLHSAFVASPHHYENLVDPAFEYVGIGVVRSGNTIYVSEVFMQMMPVKAPVVATPAPAAPPVTAPRPTTTTTARRPPAPKPVVAVVKAPAPTTTTTTTAAAPVDPPAPPVAAAPVDESRAPSALLVSVLERLRTFDS